MTSPAPQAESVTNISDTEQTRTITVHYKYENGQKAGQAVRDDSVLKIYYSKTKDTDASGNIVDACNQDASKGDANHPGYDLVSGSWDDWDSLPSSGTWGNVVAKVPKITGYTAVLKEPGRTDNSNNIDANNFVNPNWNDQIKPGLTDSGYTSKAYLPENTLYEAENEHTIYYRANYEDVQWHFVDADTGKDISDEVNNGDTFSGSVQSSASDQAWYFGDTVSQDLLKNQIKLPDYLEATEDTWPSDFTINKSTINDAQNNRVNLAIKVKFPHHVEHENVTHTFNISLNYDTYRLNYNDNGQEVGYTKTGSLGHDDNILQITMKYSGDIISDLYIPNKLVQRGSWVNPTESSELGYSVEVTASDPEKKAIIEQSFGASTGFGNGTPIAFPSNAGNEGTTSKSIMPTGDGKYVIYGGVFKENQYLPIVTINGEETNYSGSSTSSIDKRLKLQENYGYLVISAADALENSDNQVDW